MHGGLVQEEIGFVLGENGTASWVRHMSSVFMCEEELSGKGRASQVKIPPVIPIHFFFLGIMGLTFLVL